MSGVTGCPWKAVKSLRAKDETGSCQNKWPDRTQEELEVFRHWGTSRGLSYEDKHPCWRKSHLVIHHSMAQDYSATQSFENHNAKVWALPQHWSSMEALQWQTLLKYKTKDVFGAHPNLNDVRVWFVWLVWSICIEYSTFHWAINDIFTIEVWIKSNTLFRKSKPMTSKWINRNIKQKVNITLYLCLQLLVCLLDWSAIDYMDKVLFCSGYLH